MTEASLRRYKAHYDWIVIADGVSSTFGNLRAATSHIRSSLVAGKKLVMISMQPRK